MSDESKSAASALFASIPTAPADAIFGLNEKFGKDTDPRKLNLGVGAYRHHDGKPYVLPVVKAVSAVPARFFVLGVSLTFMHESVCFMSPCY